MSIKLNGTVYRIARLADRRVVLRRAGRGWRLADAMATRRVLAGVRTPCLRVVT